LFATVGHIVINVVIGTLQMERAATPFLISAGASVVMGLYCLTLPHTPPKAKGEPFSWRTAIGLDALVMMKDRSFAVFVIASVLACIPLAFYFTFTNAYLNEAGVTNAAGKMTLGQVAEIVMMLMMPFLYRRLRLKSILLLGLAAWSLRYVMLAFGNAGDLMWLFYGAILLHGICYDFFFMTGQLYTDQEAPPHLRGTAQGLIMFLTYGLGMFPRLAALRLDRRLLHDPARSRLATVLAFVRRKLLRHPAAAGGLLPFARGNPDWAAGSFVGAVCRLAAMPVRCLARPSCRPRGHRLPSTQAKFLPPMHEAGEDSADNSSAER
jgi:hypothetical protein